MLEPRKFCHVRLSSSAASREGAENWNISDILVSVGLALVLLVALY